MTDRNRLLALAETSADPYERWRALLLARQGATPEQQATLGPREHGAYSELRVRDYPLYGPVEQLAAIPGYTLAKALGLVGGRSPASIDEMAEAYRGVGRGMRSNWSELMRRRAAAIAPDAP